MCYDIREVILWHEIEEKVQSPNAKMAHGRVEYFSDEMPKVSKRLKLFMAKPKKKLKEKSKKPKLN